MFTSLWAEFSLENYTRNNKRQHDTTRVQHETTRVQHDTTRGNASTTRVQYLNVTEQEYNTILGSKIGL